MADLQVRAARRRLAMIPAGAATLSGDGCWRRE